MRFSAHPSLPRLPSCPERGEDRFECIRRGQMHVFELKDAMKVSYVEITDSLRF